APRSVPDCLRRNYDPTLVPTPGPRLPSLTPFKPSGLKESVTSDPVSRLPPSPQSSPTLNPAFLVDSPSNFTGIGTSQFRLPRPIHAAYGSSRGVHGEVTPPTDESRSPVNKDSKSKSPRSKSSPKK